MSNKVAITDTEKWSCFPCPTGVTFDKACKLFTISLSISEESISKEAWIGGVWLDGKRFCSCSLMTKFMESTSLLIWLMINGYFFNFQMLASN
jgi:hypothetical protein